MGKALKVPSPHSHTHAHTDQLSSLYLQMSVGAFNLLFHVKMFSPVYDATASVTFYINMACGSSFSKHHYNNLLH